MGTSVCTTPVLTVLSIKTFLAKYNITVFDYPPSQPDMAPCDFYLVSKIKSTLKKPNFRLLNLLNKKRQASSMRSPKKASSTITSNGKFTCSVVGIKKVCILKGIMLNMCRFKLKYFTSLVSLFNSPTLFQKFM